MFFIIAIVFIFVVIVVLKVKLDFIGGLIIGVLSGQLIPAWNYFFNKQHVNPSIVPHSQKPEFHAGIVHNNGRYMRGLVHITFMSKYVGKLKNGYFVNEISFPENTGRNTFSDTLPNISNDFSSAESNCPNTIDLINSKRGKLNGWREFSFTWKWYIPYQNDIPLGTYKVKCMVFNGNDEKPISIKHDSFIVTNMPSNSQFGDVKFH